MAGYSSLDNILEIPLPAIRKFGKTVFTKLIDNMPEPYPRYRYGYGQRLTDEEVKLRNAMDASGADRFRDLMLSLQTRGGDPLAVSQEAVATGRMSGKKLSSAQRRELAFANQTINTATSGGKQLVKVVNFMNTMPAKRADKLLDVIKKTAGELEAVNPNIMSRTLAAVARGGTPSNWASRFPVVNPGFERLISSAVKRAEKLEEGIPESQLQLPGAFPSATKSMRKLSRLLPQLKETVGYRQDPIMQPWIYRGRSGWSSNWSRIHDSGRTARDKSQLEFPSAFRARYADIAQNYTDAERTMLKNFIKENQRFGALGSQTYSYPTNLESLSRKPELLKDTVVAWNRLSPGAKAAVNAVEFDGASSSYKNMVDDLNKFADEYDALDNDQKEIIQSLGAEWTGSLGELLDMARSI